MSKKAIAEWRDGAERDWKTAQDMVTSKHYDWALFIGQLAIEKLLKGLVLKTTGQHPPFIHNLVKLGELAELNLTSKQKKELAQIAEFNVSARYDDVKYSLYRLATKRFTATWMKIMKEYVVWLKKHY